MRAIKFAELGKKPEPRLAAAAPPVPETPPQAPPAAGPRVALPPARPGPGGK